MANGGGSKRLTKAQIISELAEKTGLSKKDVQAVFSGMLDLIKQQLGKKGPGEFVIPVTISVNREDLGIAKDVATKTNLQVLIDRGLRAQLKTQSLLTGLLYVDMVFKPESPPRYVDFATGEPQLPTAPTGLEAIMERMSEVDLQSIIQNADQTLRAVSSLLANPETQRVPANINATLTDVRTLIANTDRQVALLGARLDTLAGSADGTLGALRVQVKETGTRLDASLQTLDQTLASLRLTSDEAGYALAP